MTVLSVGYPLARISESTAGGAEQILLMLDHALVRLGHRSLVVAPAGSQTHGLLLPVPSPTGVLDETAKRESRVLFKRELERTLRLFPVDVVHMHGLDFDEYLPEQNVPAVVTLHLPLSWYASGALNPRRASTKLICVSQSQARSAPPEARIADVIANGIDVDRLRPTGNHGEYVLAMGRICPEKGFHLAIEAAGRAAERLILAGELFPYPEHQEYLQKVIAARLGQNVRFVGPVGGERKTKLLAGAKCVLIPSLAPETSSLIAMEALACGTPVVAMHNGALPEIIRDGETGFLVDTVEGMANAIRNIHVIDRRKCRREAERSFSAEKMISCYLRLYQSAILPANVEELAAA